LPFVQWVTRPSKQLLPTLLKAYEPN